MSSVLKSADTEMTAAEWQARCDLAALYRKYARAIRGKSDRIRAFAGTVGRRWRRSTSGSARYFRRAAGRPLVDRRIGSSNHGRAVSRIQ